MSDSEGFWFNCKGCGQPAVYFPGGVPPHLPPGAVGHSRPAEACAFYQSASPAEFWLVHMSQPRLEAPPAFEPMPCNTVGES